MDSESLARDIRRLSLKMVAAAGASHIGACLSIADILGVLYGEVLKYSHEDENADDRDRFILSKGHACAALYAALAKVGFFPESRLAEFGLNDSIFMTHVSHKVPGVEFSTGSLGHGLPFAVGKALAMKISGNKSRVFALLGDGELDEGTTWEATLFANHHNLNNLVAIVDRNGLQSMKNTEETMKLESLEAKFTSLGWDFEEIDGHNHRDLVRALGRPNAKRPSAIVARTVKGKGVSFMENQIAWHYKSPNEEELRIALEDVENLA